MSLGVAVTPKINMEIENGKQLHLWLHGSQIKFNANFYIYEHLLLNEVHL